MLFCPYGRDFTKSYDEYTPREYTPALNKFTWDDMNGDLYLSQLSDWKKLFDGESIVFDYSLYDDTNYFDLTNLRQTPVTVRGTLYLEKLGLNGKLECGNVVTMSPTALMLNGVAQGLFYGTKISEKEYFRDAFGPNEVVYELLDSIKNVPPYDYLKGKRTELTFDEKKELSDAIKRIHEFRNGLYEFGPDNVFHRKNYEFLLYYLEIVEYVFGLIAQNADYVLKDDCDAYVEKLRKMVFRAEERMPAYFSGIDFFNYMRELLKAKRDKLDAHY